MNITMNEFSPFISPLEIGDNVLHCRAFDLRAETWAEQNFESLSNFISLITEGNSSAIYAGIHTLLVKKDISFSAFVKTICLKPHKDAKENLKTMFDYLIELLKDSQPMIKNPTRAKEIQKAKAKAENEDVNYASIFDKVAARYGYSIETFFSLTSRQLHAVFKAIGDADYKDLEVRAALAGRKLKEQMHFPDITVEEEESNHSDALGAIERHKERFKKDNK